MVFRSLNVITSLCVIAHNAGKYLCKSLNNNTNRSVNLRLFLLCGFMLFTVLKGTVLLNNSSGENTKVMRSEVKRTGAR